MRNALLLCLTLAPLAATAGEIDSSAGPMAITPVATGLDEPWGLAFLPGGGFLVTERGGQLWWITEAGRVAVSGLPKVFAEGQGGLLDVMVPADFAASREIWLSYAAPVPGGAATAAGHGRLTEDGRLDGFTPVFQAEAAPGGRHFGARLVEAADGAVFLTTGERGTGPGGQEAQDPSNALGKVIRLARDGSPGVQVEGWRAGVWSVGHRNIQGAALDLGGRLLTVEHGAQGGDEVNAPAQGRNYGWPVISYGVNYGGGPIGEGTAKDGMEQPLHVWDPSIAPSGLMVYSGALVPDWRGDVFTGSLNSDFLARLDPETPAPTGWAEERLAAPETGRVRDVAEAPDGSIWFLSVSDGAVYRLAPVGR
ncbi:PQQ-dependent sugar dehydrogenase [Xinfangfangia pollutisoli]|uniref:PQQ-dependent sugar dehydrogenase n=1 Tax=Xinfangfangia pollutisoli TaxID=2865960 RepID=UPI001CD1D674|nr:PQQ-dependent sugar dehydrogenase [Xinfangfangia pollutisoli]